MFSKLRSYILSIMDLDIYNADHAELSNIRPISNSEKNAAQIIRKNPQLNESELIRDYENGWVRVSR